MKEEGEKSEIPVIQDENGRSIEVPSEGSLGLLALGYKGLMAWRAQRNPELYQNPSSLSNTSDEEE